MWFGLAQHFPYKHRGAGESRTTPAPLSTLANGKHSANFVREVGANARKPLMWYLPPSALTASKGRPPANISEHVQSIVFFSRINTTVIIGEI